MKKHRVDNSLNKVGSPLRWKGSGQPCDAVHIFVLLLSLITTNESFVAVRVCLMSMDDRAVLCAAPGNEG